MDLHFGVDVVEPLHVLAVNLALRVVLGDVAHLTLPLLGVGLRESDVAASGDVRTLLDGVLTQDLEVGLLLELLPVVGDGLLFGDYSDHLATIKGFVSDLDLERYFLNLRQVEVLHLNELGNFLQSVLEGDLGVSCHVTDFASHK